MIYKSNFTAQLDYSYPQYEGDSLLRKSQAQRDHLAGGL